MHTSNFFLILLLAVCSYYACTVVLSLHVYGVKRLPVADIF